MKTAEQMKRDEIKRLERKRAILMWLIVILWTLCIIHAIFFVSKPQGQVEQQKDKQVFEYIVKANDTIDKLAKRYYSDTYPLQARADIKKLNNMKTCDIYEGQTILLEREVE